MLATVKGDVHDIGKNLVDIILTNNGYDVVNLGIKQPVTAILEAARRAQGRRHRHVRPAGEVDGGDEGEPAGDELPRDRQGLPGHPRRRGADPRLRRAGPRRGVRRRRPLRPRRVRGPAPHGRADGGQARRGHAGAVRGEGREGGRAQGPARPLARDRGARAAQEEEPVERRPLRRRHRQRACRPRRSGARRITKGIALADYAAWLDERALFLGQWGLRGARRGSGPSYEELVETEGRPRLRALLSRVQTEGIMEAAVVHGYFPAVSKGEDLIVLDPDSGDERCRFTFPRQRRDRRLCLADFFRSQESGETDVVAFQVVTMGAHVSEVANELFARNAYREYLELHGLSVQLTEALAEYWHARVRAELGLRRRGLRATCRRCCPSRPTAGARYSFGYPACPDVEDQDKVQELLEWQRIGVELSEESSSRRSSRPARSSCTTPRRSTSRLGRVRQASARTSSTTRAQAALEGGDAEAVGVRRGSPRCPTRRPAAARRPRRRRRRSGSSTKTPVTTSTQRVEVAAGAQHHRRRAEGVALDGVRPKSSWLTATSAAAVGVEPAQLGVGDVGEALHVGRPVAAAGRPADDDEALARHAGDGLADDLGVLVAARRGRR